MFYCVACYQNREDEAELVTSRKRYLHEKLTKRKHFIMQSDDVFCDMINSIQFLNMSKAKTDDGANVNFGDSGFNSGAEMNSDNIFFYEDSCPSLQSCLDMKTTSDEQSSNMDPRINRDHQLPSPNYEQSSAVAPINHRNQHEKELTQIQVNVGIDEDLKMILEMDPSLMDVTLEKAVEPSSHVVDCPKILGLPPKG